MDIQIIFATSRPLLVPAAGGLATVPEKVVKQTYIGWSVLAPASVNVAIACDNSYILETQPAK